MFEGSTSCCAPAEAVKAPDNDRRVWIRYPSDRLAICQSAAGNGKATLARVRNISRGGISLISDRRYEPGKLLSIQLPGIAEQGTSTVLACVLHVAMRPGQEWVLGCAFATELSDADLEAFGAERRRPVDPDQRAWERFPCSVSVTYRPTDEEDGPEHTAEVDNISASGIGLVVSRPVEVGMLLSLELRGSNGETRLSMLASIVRVTELIGGRYFCGSNFITRLTERELEELM